MAIQIVTTGSQTATVTITDTDVSEIGVASVPANVSEGDTGVFRISLSKPADTPTTVTLTNVGGTATAGADYTGLGSSTVVVIPALSTSVDVTISALNDTLAEGNETVIVDVFSTPSSYAGRLVASSNDATMTIEDADDLVVEGVIINNGAVQRSRLTTVSVDLNGVVNSGQEALFEVRNRNTNTLVPLANMSFAYDYTSNPGKTRVTITFTGSGTNVLFGSLVDGNYDITVKAALVNTASQSLGTDFVFGNVAGHNFYRLFGDLNADRKVSSVELNAMLFAFTTSTLNPSLDFNNDGVMSSADLNQVLGRFNLYGVVAFPFV
jgi:hypothetical protein